ncbi:Syntenin-1 [Eumeta japonica]|uniref:Syntenin-1 n=1 Tax=Eumeta variegata TaxID=151549 RepID=A0A4C1U6C1_EUMVA|nr:Syntenin-1 [Eumeta japonica]
MALYPSLEDMKVDNMVRAQLTYQANSSIAQNYPSAPPSYPSASPSALTGHVYPALAEYMGLELSSDVIALNMPEYQVQQPFPLLVHHTRPLINTSNHITVKKNLCPSRRFVLKELLLDVPEKFFVWAMTVMLYAQSTTLQKAIVSQAIRQVVLCKDGDGKVGVRLHSVNNGVFVCYVAAGSPAALAGLRFGDQVLEINNIALAGMSMDKCHEILRKAPVNGITMAVRDRPFERTVTLHKDSLGHVGFHFKDGKIVGLVKDSSAARNGVLTEHQILEINTINVVGMKDKEISKVINESPSVVNITIIPYYIYKHMISKMSTSLFKELDRTPAV